MIDPAPNSAAGEPRGPPQARSVPPAPSLSSLPAARPRSARGSRDIKEISLKVKVVTPIMGGGTQTRTIDEVDVIRPATVRGHLRFWWRALNASQSQYSDPKELSKEEGNLWGRAAGDEGGRSTVDIRIKVDLQSMGEIDKADIQLGSADSYATWPAQAQKKTNTPPAPRRKPGTQFQLTLICPAEREREVCNAVRAWLLFGGYGGRTRRGLGSLTVTENPNQWLPSAPTRDALKSLFGHDVFAHAQLPLTDTPRLDGASLHVSDGVADATKAWTTALGWLREFRQGTTGDKGNIARNPGQGPRPSVSNWPEADKVRHLTGKTRGHTPRHNSKPVWPRAGFGLPIIGQFQTHGGAIEEPRGFELKWRSVRKEKEKENEKERLASPLIVKALPLASGQFAPCALWLNRAYPQGEVFAKGLEGSGAPFHRLIAEGDTPKFNALAGKSSLREAFLDWLRRKYRTTGVAP